MLANPAFAAAAAKATVKNWRSPIPRHYSWIDNYMSRIAVEHEEASNFCLTKASLDFRIKGGHSYSHEWYRGSALPAGQSFPGGFRKSRESGFSGDLPKPGKHLWVENINLTFNFNANPLPGECLALQAVSLAVKPVSAAVRSVAAVGNAGEDVLDFGADTIEAAGRLVIKGYHATVYVVDTTQDLVTEAVGVLKHAVVQTAGAVKTKMVETTDQLLDAAAQTDRLLREEILKHSIYFGTPTLRLELENLIVGNQQEPGTEGEIAAATQAPGAWLKVRVPANAGQVAFDFTYTGNPGNDRVTCAVNDQNLFSLPLRLVEEGQIHSTDLMTFSEYAGKEVEFFFGLTGGTAGTCKLEIQGLRFILMPQPTLSAVVKGQQAILQWPAAATGWGLETSTNLTSGTWTTVDTSAATVLDIGVRRLAQPLGPSSRFYRLRQMRDDRPQPPPAAPPTMANGFAVDATVGTAGLSWNANGTEARKWRVQVGTAAGLGDVYDSGDLPPNTSSHNLPLQRLPANGTRVYVQLWYETDSWKKLETSYVVEGRPSAVPDGFALIPAGEFQMGDSFGEGEQHERPVHIAKVGKFYISKNEITKREWDATYNWAIANGFEFENRGSGRGPEHPVHTVSWFDAVKWCNAKSLAEGLEACYTLDGAIYKTEGDRDEVSCNFSRNGYRLPTEAEWEKAARGGLSGRRFPWGDDITHSHANYYSSAEFSYDVSPSKGPHPNFVGSVSTSPVASFNANAYGLYDMTGNVWEWCWDRYGDYPSISVTDPRGPDWVPNTLSSRIIRGGAWGFDARCNRAAFRGRYFPGYRFNYMGFRLARIAM